MTLPVRSLESTALLRFRAFAVALAWTLAAFAGTAAAAPAGTSPLAAPPGLRVEAVETGSLAERAGLRAGDVLLEWRRDATPPVSPLPAGGPLEAPFDLDGALEEEAPRGALNLIGKRGESERTWVLVAGASAERAGLRSRPSLPPELETPFRAGEAAWASGDAALGSRLWAGAASRAFALRNPGAGLWLLRERALALLRTRDFPAADSAFAEALAPAALAGEGGLVADLLLTWGRSYDERGLWDEARLRLERGLAALRPSAALLLRARLQFALGEVFRHRDDYGSAWPAHELALRLRQSRAPNSLACAESLFALARLRYETRAPEAPSAEQLARAAVRMVAGIEAGSLLEARILDYLGLVVWNEGRTSEGERLFEEALRAASSRAPKSYEAARILLHWGTALDRRGNLGTAEALFSEALAIWQSLAPTALNLRNLAVTWWSLAYLKTAEGDLETAEADARRALEIQESIQTRSVGVAEALDILGHVETGLGRFEEGRLHLRRAVALREELMPGQLGLTTSLFFLGALELAAGDHLAEAERVLRRSEALFEGGALVNLARADTVSSLAEAIGRQGRLEEALTQAERSLALRRSLSPGGPPEAESLNQVGRLQRQAGKLPLAAESLCQAVGIIDRLGDRLAGAQRARSSFTAAYASYYFDCLEARLGQGREAEAFGALEAGRARALLDLFTTRDLDLLELPPALRREREELYEEYARLSERLSAASAGEAPSVVEALRRDLLENQRRHDGLSVRIRAAVPRLASLRYPLPLDLAQACRALDPGTTLLAYAVGVEGSYLFVVRPAGSEGPGLKVFPLPVGSASLSREVEEFRSVVSDPDSAEGAIRERGERLFRLLLGPAEAILEGAERLVIVPDGALHLLPFAALTRTDGRFLAEWKPIHKIASATVYAEVKSRRGKTIAPAGSGAPKASRVGLVGDPTGEGNELPGSRRELTALAELFGRSARVLAGPEATEARVAALAADVDLLHFATHAYVDEARPLSSALLLSAPSAEEKGAAGTGDGRLEAWEIIERIRLRASLVTLSACETGLGRDMGGEGLIGLTRAFQLAGARSVLSSLWAVGDGSTARFMPRFYRHLLAGRSKDDALRLAQLESLRDPLAPAEGHPSLWAAFELTGDDR